VNLKTKLKYLKKSCCLQQTIKDRWNCTFSVEKILKITNFECIRRVQLVKASNENEENLKKYFIIQFVSFSCEINVVYFSEYNDFIKKIEDSLGDKILIRIIGFGFGFGNAIVKEYRLKLLDEIKHYENCNCEIRSFNETNVTDESDEPIEPVVTTGISDELRELIRQVEI
jgi:hypothetical protein